MADPKAALKAMNTAFDALEPLDPEERQRAMTWLSETLEVSPTDSGGPPPPPPPGGGGNADDDESQTAKEFLAEKKPETDAERITCVAYYLTHMRGITTFKTADLTALNQEAAGRRFTNAATTAKNAVNQNGYLAQAGQGRRQIASLGEQVVEAMPDREAVKAAIAAAHRPRRRSARRSKVKNASKP